MITRQNLKRSDEKIKLRPQYYHNNKKLTVYFVFLIIFDDILSLGISNTYLRFIKNRSRDYLSDHNIISFSSFSTYIESCKIIFMYFFQIFGTIVINFQTL